MQTVATRQRNHGRTDPWILIAGSFHRNGGMDKANLALAEYLVQRGNPVHLVTHRVEAPEEFLKKVTIHHVPLPAGSWFLGSYLLDWRGRQVIAQVKQQHRNAIALSNGSNCPRGDVNWSHYVHGAWAPAEKPQGLRGWKKVLERKLELGRERRAYRAATKVISNSEFTRRHVEDCVGRNKPDIKTIYLGSEDWGAVSAEERAAARQQLGIAPERKIAIFVGALGADERKGFDLLFDAWRGLCADPEWDADLLVAGDGPVLEQWRARTAEAGLEKRIQMLGFRRDVPVLLAAADVLVSPTRYEPYGLNLQEAYCRGLTVIMSKQTGIAERLNPVLAELVVDDVENVDAWKEALRRWRQTPERWREPSMKFGEELRRRGWMQMAAEMVEWIEK